MSNGQLHDDKLFQGLHDRLSDYEAPYDGADWDAMSRALDKLPKTNQFRWKFSLNTIGIMLGIVGLTVLGVVIAQGNGKPSSPAENRTPTTTSVAPENNTPAVTKTNPPAAMLPVNTADGNETSTNTVAVQEINTRKDLTQPRERKSTYDNPFRLGDQIDPAKGFVYETQDDPALINNKHDFKKPEVYYDIDETTGKTKKIYIQDTVNGVKEVNQTDSITPAPQSIPEPSAPTEGQRIGFDN
jgi:hypothetical protein